MRSHTAATRAKVCIGISAVFMICTVLWLAKLLPFSLSVAPLIMGSVLPLFAACVLLLIAADG